MSVFKVFQKYASCCNSGGVKRMPRSQFELAIAENLLIEESRNLARFRSSLISYRAQLMNATHSRAVLRGITAPELPDYEGTEVFSDGCWLTLDVEAVIEAEVPPEKPYEFSTKLAAERVYNVWGIRKPKGFTSVDSDQIARYFLYKDEWEGVLSAEDLAADLKALEPEFITCRKVAELAKKG